jgi:cell division protease FtsH
LGHTLSLPQYDQVNVYKSILKKEIAMTLGGRAAEEIINADFSAGPSGDINHVTKLAKNMVTRWGMSEILGPRAFGSDQGEVFLGCDFSSSQDYSEEIAAKIDAEIHAILTEAYDKAKAILLSDIDKMHFIADFLMKNESMDGDQFKAIMETDVPTMEQIEAIAEAKKKQSEDANKSRAEQDKKAAEDSESTPGNTGDEQKDDNNSFRRNTDTGF